MDNDLHTLSPQEVLAKLHTEEMAGGVTSDTNHLLASLEDDINALVDNASTVELGEMAAENLVADQLITRLRVPQNVARQMATRFVQKASDGTIDRPDGGRSTLPQPEISPENGDRVTVQGTGIASQSVGVSFSN